VNGTIMRDTIQVFAHSSHFALLADCFVSKTVVSNRILRGSTGRRSNSCYWCM